MNDIFRATDLLEIIEAYAADNNGIESEDHLSEIFDDQIAPMVIEQYGEDDDPAMNETFTNWSDSLCKDGVLHNEQYRLYCYVGKYA